MEEKQNCKGKKREAEVSFRRKTKVYGKNDNFILLLTNLMIVLNLMHRINVS